MLDCRRGCRDVTEAVLTQLGQFDRRHGSEAGGARREGTPRVGGVRVPTDTTEQVRALDEEPTLRPRGNERLGQGRGAVPHRPAAEVRPSSWRPPRVAVVGAVGRRIRHADATEREVETADRLLESALAGEGSGETRQIARIGPPARDVVAEVPFDLGEEASQRPHVLVVVADDVDEGLWRRAAQDVEVARRDLPTLDVTDPANPEQHRLDRPKAGVRQPVSEYATDERQEVEVAGGWWGRSTDHPIARDEERPVEAAPVVRHEPRVGRDERGEQVEQRRLVGMVREQKLDLAEVIVFPPPETDEEGERAGRGGEAGRLRVEADERCAARRLARQRLEAPTVDRDGASGPLDPED